jgi:hypothetical protein
VIIPPIYGIGAGCPNFRLRLASARQGKFWYQLKSQKSRIGDKVENNEQIEIAVSGRSKPAREGRMKTSHFEGRIALSAVETAQGRDEHTQAGRVGRV